MSAIIGAHENCWCSKCPVNWKDDLTVGHVPQKQSRILWYFVSHSGKLTAKVTGRYKTITTDSRQFGDSVYFHSRRKRLVQKLRGLIVKTARLYCTSQASFYLFFLHCKHCHTYRYRYKQRASVSCPNHQNNDVRIFRTTKIQLYGVIRGKN